MKFNILLLTVLAIVLFRSEGRSQFPYKESFKNSSVSGLVISGASKLTAASSIDAEGQGYLRLTENINNSIGYVFAEDSFPSSYGLTATFEFFTYKAGANGSNQADGISFFLFDASVNSFRPGGFGGSLGYAQKNGIPGIAKGYIGIGIDEFGNFSNALDGEKNGGIGQKKGSVTVRGPGNGRSASDYVYIASVKADSSLFNAGFTSFTQRYPDSVSANYRRLKIILTPGSSAGASVGYTLTVIMIKGGTPVVPVTLINQLDYPYPAPAKLQYGMAASTGSITDLHEIRNMNIEVTNSAALVASTTANDFSTVCQGQDAIVDVTANDNSGNIAGAIEKSSVDLDPALAGQQTTFTDAGKGTYVVDKNGIVTFTPVTGFSGNSSIVYRVNDIYGATSGGSSTITISVLPGAGPSLTITNPTPACNPAVIDITSSSWKSNFTTGATFDYFNTLSNANSNTSNINATASSISISGTYYIRASYNGCSTIKPLTVQISRPPTVSNAGSDQNSCSSTGGVSLSLTGNNPDMGVGTWTQVSGAAATIINPHSSISPTSSLQKGVYDFRWTIASEGCPPSTDDIRMTVGVPSVAGNNQTLANATSVSLAANDPAPGIGNWTQVSGPAATITASANPMTTASGLVAGNVYVFKWTITNGACNTSSQVTITDLQNTVAYAGTDITVSNTNTVTLSANAPDAANSGLWSLVSSPAGSSPIITDPANRNTTVTNLNRIGDFIFRWTITNSTVSNFDDVKLSVLSLLPVTYLTFSGKAADTHINLEWQTTAEDRNVFFSVEWSFDGIEFTAAASIPASSSTGPIRSYHYVDNIEGALVPAIYYRLRQVDRDGGAQYSNTISVQLVPASIAGKAWPNPFKDHFSVMISSASASSAALALFNEAGHLAWSASKRLVTGKNMVAIQDLPPIKPGIYILQITTNDHVYKEKLIKR